MFLATRCEVENADAQHCDASKYDDAGEPPGVRAPSRWGCVCRTIVTGSMQRRVKGRLVER
jgi:hypothetical protein